VAAPAAAATLLVPAAHGFATRYYYDLPMIALLWLGVACVLAAGQLWHTTSSELGLLAMAHGKRVSNISDFRREAGGAFYPIYRHLWRRDDAAQALDELAAWEASGLLFLDMDDLEARIRAHYRLAMQLRAELRPLAAPFLPPQEAE